MSKLERTPPVFKEYSRVISKQLASGIVEEVDEDDVGVLGELHYIPHQVVVRLDKKTTKVRVVYDASSRTAKHPPMNSCLHSGPNLLEHLSDVLLRFRCHAVALVGDIEKAFLMMKVAENDRDVLRFLW